jgi:protein O-GlcNAc transferase
MAGVSSGQINQQAWDLLRRGEEAQARTLLLNHLKRQPRDAEANKTLAMIHGAHDENERAVFYLQRALAAAPADGQARFMLGNVLMTMRKHRDAAAAYRECLKIAPGDIASCDGLGKCLISLGEHGEAAKVFRVAITAHPDNPDAYGNMGVALAVIGKLDEALAVAREGLARLPGNAALLEFLAFNMNYAEGVDPIEHRRVHDALGDAFARERGGAAETSGAGGVSSVTGVTGPSSVVHAPASTRDPHKRLRVGFLSGDYSLHACALFLKAPLLNFDRTRIEPVCISTSDKNDGGDAPFRAACEWHSLHSADPGAVAAHLAGLGLDILVDCSGLSEGHRLRALTPRVAPVQATWLGYPNTTGLPTMDYRIVDAHTDPPGSETHCRERLTRVDGCFLCFTPDERAPLPPPTPAMQDAGAPVVFGSFNRLSKVTAGTLDAWCGVLRAVEGSTMLLKLQILSPTLQKELRAEFARRGVDPARLIAVEFVKTHSEHLGTYARMDIALDAFPYNGTTTTCEAAWMGVPVITLEGSTHRSRVGVSLLHALGLPELIAHSTDEYISIAAGLAADRARLTELKRGMRERMQQSPLCDAPGYAVRFEKVLRGMWQGA